MIELTKEQLAEFLSGAEQGEMTDEERSAIHEKISAIKKEISAHELVLALAGTIFSADLEMDRTEKRLLFVYLIFTIIGKLFPDEKDEFFKVFAERGMTDELR